MGTDFGKESEGTNSEDLEFQGETVEGIKRLISVRSSKYSVWGWKDPGTITHINELKDSLRNPFYMSIYRDPYAIAQSESQRNDRQVDIGLKMAMEQLQKLTEFNTRYLSQKIQLSYEKVLLAPRKTVEDIISFLGLSPSRKQVANAVKYISPGKYGTP